MQRTRRIMAIGGALLTLIVLSAGMAGGGSYPALWPVALVTNAALCIPAYLALSAWIGSRRAAVIIAGLGLYAFEFESLAVATGWPYGAFVYGDLLGPRLAGLVPPPVFFAWTPLIVAVAILTWRIRRRRLRVLTVAFGLVLIDAVLDPGAVALGYWAWQQPGAYYGVPLVNFGGWLISGGLAATALVLTIRAPVPPPQSVRFAGYSLGVIVALWTSVSLWLGLFGVAAVGIVAGAFVITVTRFELQRPQTSANKV